MSRSEKKRLKRLRRKKRLKKRINMERNTPQITKDRQKKERKFKGLKAMPKFTGDKSE